MLKQEALRSVLACTLTLDLDARELHWPQGLLKYVEEHEQLPCQVWSPSRKGGGVRALRMSQEDCPMSSYRLAFWQILISERRMVKLQKAWATLLDGSNVTSRDDG